MTESRRRRALIVDDDPDICELIAALLETMGFETESLADGIGALELQHCYDIVILDLNMPVFDGERLVTYWQMTAPELLNRVIVLSGYSGFARGRELPTFATLAKPFEPRDLIDVVQRCLDANTDTLERSLGA